MKKKFGVSLLMASAIIIGLTSCDTNVDELKVQSIDIGDDRKELEMGTTFSLNTVISPETATNKNVNYFSDNVKVATISNNGVISALLPGEATITAVSEDNGKAIDRLNLVVTGTDPNEVIDVESINLGQDKTVVAGSTLTLEPVISPANATNKEITFFSNNEDVATVSSAGEITTLKAGKVKITCISNSSGVKDEITLTVTELPISIEGFAVEKTSYEVEVNEQLPLSVGFLPENTTEREYNFVFVEETSTDSALLSKTNFLALVAGTYKIKAVSLANSFIESEVITITAIDKNAQKLEIVNGLKTKLDEALVQELASVDEVTKIEKSFDNNNGTLDEKIIEYKVYENESGKLHNSGTETTFKKTSVSTTSETMLFSNGYLDETETYYQISVDSIDKSDTSYSINNYASEDDAITYDDGISIKAKELLEDILGYKELEYEISFDTTNNVYKLIGSGDRSFYYWETEYCDFETIFEFNTSGQLVKFNNTFYLNDDNNLYTEEERIYIGATYTTSRKDESNPDFSLKDLVISDADVTLKQGYNGITNGEVYISDGTDSNYLYSIKSENVMPISANTEYDGFIFDETQLPDGVAIKQQYNGTKNVYFTKEGTFNVPVTTIRGGLEATKLITVTAKIPNPTEVEILVDGFTSFYGEDIYINETVDNITIKVSPTTAPQDVKVELKDKNDEGEFVDPIEEIATLAENSDGSYSVTGLKVGTIYVVATSLVDESVSDNLKINIKKTWNEAEFTELFNNGTYVFDAVADGKPAYEQNIKNRAVATIDTTTKKITIIGSADTTASDVYNVSLNSLKLVFNYTIENNTVTTSFAYSESDCSTSTVKYSKSPVLSFGEEFNEISILNLLDGDNYGYSLSMKYVLKEAQ